MECNASRSVYSLAARSFLPTLGAILIGLVSVGCASNGYAHIEPKHSDAASVDVPEAAQSQVEKIRQDPRAFVRAVYENCQKLSAYTVKMTRYERRGMFQSMYGPEHIACWYRQTPFSVRFKWLDADIKYGESTYVAGQHNSKVRFVTRRPELLLKPPPQINEIEPQTSVTFGESRSPVTDFGLERLMERTITTMTKAAKHVRVTYEGLFKLEETGATVYHLHLDYDDGFTDVPLQELYVSVDTNLPVGTILKERGGRIAAAYFYDNLDTSAALTDDDFLLDVERGGKK